MKPKRKGISKSVRFEVFKRDSFTCQYCGGKAPEIVLHVDHIHPVAEGGTDEIANLITSCQPCNTGKGKRKLKDSQATQKSYSNVRHEAERADQIAMIADWHRASLAAVNDAVNVACDVWASLCGEPPQPDVVNKMHGLAKRHGLDALIKGIEYSAKRNLTYYQSGGLRPYSVRDVERWLPASVGLMAKPKHVRDTQYIMGIAKRLFGGKADELIPQWTPEIQWLLLNKKWEPEALIFEMKRCTVDEFASAIDGRLWDGGYYNAA